MKNGIYAIIYLGSSSISMQISEFSKGKEKSLETMNKYIALGVDTYSRNILSLDKIYQVSDILKNFQKKLQEYGVKNNYSAVCTSAVREAENRLFLMDMIKRNSGIDLKILTDTDEMYIKYLGCKHRINQFSQFEKEGILFANISSGTVTMKIIKDEKLLYSEALPYGSLRLAEMFRDTDTFHLSRAYTQYIENMIESLMGSVGKDIHLPYFVSSGSSITLLQHVIKSSDFKFKREDLQSLYQKIKNYDIENIEEKFKFSTIQARSLLPTLITYLNILKITGNDYCHFTPLPFNRMLSQYYSNNLKDKGLVKRFKSMLRRTGQKYNFDRKHALHVMGFSNIIFNKLKKIHLMGAGDKVLLEAAAILHDTGYFINAEDHEEHSYYITKSIKFPGIEKKKMDMIAAITRFHRKSVKERLYKIRDFNMSDRLKIMKLAGILRIGDSLDAGHKQLIKKIDVIIETDKIIIDGFSKIHPHLEIKSFRKKSKFIEEVFGIKFKFNLRSIHE